MICNKYDPKSYSHGEEEEEEDMIEITTTKPQYIMSIKEHLCNIL